MLIIREGDSFFKLYIISLLLMVFIDYADDLYYNIIK